MRILIVLIVTLLAACVREPDLSLAEAKGVIAASEQVMRSNDLQVSIPEQRWPEQILVLKPESVRLTPEGLYVVTSSWFVEEVGFFIPRYYGVLPDDSGEPKFRRLHENLFSYRISG